MEILAILAVLAIIVGILLVGYLYVDSMDTVAREQTRQRQLDYQIEQERTIQVQLLNERVLNWSMALLPYFGGILGVIAVGAALYFGTMVFFKRQVFHPPQIVTHQPAQLPPVVNMYFFGDNATNKGKAMQLLSQAGHDPRTLIEVDREQNS